MLKSVFSNGGGEDNISAFEVFLEGWERGEFGALIEGESGYLLEGID